MIAVLLVILVFTIMPSNVLPHVLKDTMVTTTTTPVNLATLPVDVVPTPTNVPAVHLEPTYTMPNVPQPVQTVTMPKTVTVKSVTIPV